jgi:hypothetical protein
MDIDLQIQILHGGKNSLLFFSLDLENFCILQKFIYLFLLKINIFFMFLIVLMR